ncbi:hybrid sensor histidine kinase/response regulator [Rhodovibrio salinarum]|uniref:hybrid sensor histidine kinase/response regulator n=1 Tax=Rhodovibrio salinarum TaxID=1087 RepID=UPI0006855718|nr:ATP-binding protein [Rhodovibrio salinarum]
MLAFFALVATGTGVSLYQQLSDLRAAPQDNVQWSLAQLEADLLRLQTAVQDAQAFDGEIAQVRRHFDLFYSRAQTVRQGRGFAELRRVAQVDRDLQQVQSFLETIVPIVDSDNETLRRQLDQVHNQVRSLLPVVRDISLAGVRLHAAQSDSRRQNFVNALLTASAVAFGLIVLLVLTLAVLDRQHRISLRRAAEVSHSRDRLSATIGASLDAVVVADAAGRIVDWNGAAERIFGYSHDQAVGAEMTALIIPEGERAQHRRTMQRYLRDSSINSVDTGRFETTALNAHGTVFPVELALGVSQGPDGPIIIYYLRDISSRRAQQAALVAARDEALAAERAKTDFLAVMSHEMRTPLNGVLGVLDLLERTDLDAQQRRYVATAVGSGGILLKHINDVLDVTRVEAGKMVFQKEAIDLRAVLDETLMIGAPMVEQKGNTAKVTGDEPTRRVLGDPHRLRQVLLNLFSNAAKFTRNGHIELELRVADTDDDTSDVEIAVNDTGPGIPPPDRKRIFDDFVTLNSSYDRNAGGSGLGLAICRRIVEAMGGEIGVTPGAGDRGSRFWIRLALPWATDAADESNVQSAGGDLATPAGYQVLLVEDNEVNRMVAVEMLRQAGHHVSEAHDGLSGIAAAAQRRFDLILMDISMPAMDGVEATQAIRQGGGFSKNTPIVALTAHALPEDRRRFADAGMQDAIIKPLRRTELLAIVARYVTQKQESVTAAAVPQAATPSPTPPDEDDALGEEDDIIDADVLSDLSVTLPPETLNRTISMVRREIASGLSVIETTARGPDDAELARQVHRMAGCAAMVGAYTLHGVCGVIEEACKRGDGETARAKIDVLRDSAMATESILAEFAEETAA